MKEYMRAEQLQSLLTGLLDIKDMKKMFRVSGWTLHKWRAKPGPNKTVLPAVVIPGTGRPALRFVEPEVREWAK
jgi:hypothetical protein